MMQKEILFSEVQPRLTPKANQSYARSMPDQVETQESHGAQGYGKATKSQSKEQDTFKDMLKRADEAIARAEENYRKEQTQAHASAEASAAYTEY